MNALTELLGIRYPILLGPFGGVSSVKLAAAVSAAGGLGSFGLYGYIRETAAALRGAADRAINFNLWMPTGDEVRPADVDWPVISAAVGSLYDELSIAHPARPASFLPSFDEQIHAVLEARPRVVSFVYGVPSAQVIERFRRIKTRVIGTATNVSEARALDDAGVDAIVATGAEAAGHRVTFIGAAEESLNGTFTLVPQVIDAVSVPVIAVGGIADRRGVAAAFALGAQGVQVGSAFLVTAESAAPPAHKQAIRASARTGTRLTRAMSGRLARGIANHAMRTLEARPVAPFPAQNVLTGAFRSVAAERNQGEYLSLGAGQASPLARGETAGSLFGESHSRVDA